MKTPKILADKINELLSKENEENSSDESSTETSAPRVTEFLDDEYELPQAQTTDIRKRNIKLLSEQSTKYKGKLTSRKELENEEECYEESDSEFEEMPVAESETESDDDDKEAFKSFGNKIKQISNGKMQHKEEVESDGADENEEVDSEAGEEEDDDDDDDDDEDEFDQSDIDEEEQQIVSETNRQTELQKGICVQNQLRIWEKLLEMRIQSQKMLTKANQLPAPEEFQAQTIQTEETVKNVSSLLSKLLELQQTLSQQYPELSKEVKTTQKRPSNSISNDEPASKRFGTDLQQHFQAFRNYRNNVLLKWDDRTKVMTPGAGNKRKSAQEDYDILRKITHALNSRQELIQRSQILSSNNSQTVENVNKDADEAVPTLTHVYDDSDFYHQQLRELIEYKANTTSNMAEVTKQYVELQKLRQKMKKKVDTRASKGRKIRYGVHKKLLNFMAPEETSTWTEESKEELYKSLFVA